MNNTFYYYYVITFLMCCESERWKYNAAEESETKCQPVSRFDFA